MEILLFMLTDEKNWGIKNLINCPRLHSQWVAKQTFKVRPFWLLCQHLISPLPGFLVSAILLYHTYFKGLVSEQRIMKNRGHHARDEVCWVSLCTFHIQFAHLWLRWGTQHCIHLCLRWDLGMRWPTQDHPTNEWQTWNSDQDLFTPNCIISLVTVSPSWRE